MTLRREYECDRCSAIYANREQATPQDWVTLWIGGLGPERHLCPNCWRIVEKVIKSPPRLD